MVHFLYFLCFFSFLTLTCKAQGKIITLHLKKETRTLKEQPLFNEIIPQKEQIFFVKGIPHKLLGKYTFSRYLIFETDEHKLKIPTLIGRDTLNNPVFILDRNLNFDFSDDSIRYYSDSIKKSIKDFIIEDSIIIRQSGPTLSLNIKYVFIKPSFVGVDYKDEHENSFFLMVGSNNIYSTLFTVNNKITRIIIVPQKPLNYTKESLKLYISYDTSSNFKIDNSQALIAHNIGDTLLIAGKAFRFKSFSLSNSLLELDELWENANLTNAYPGFYPYDIAMNDINNDFFNLNDFRGNYVLLDFWGTWCEPCKKITPKLIELYNEFKDQGLIVVSIALDKNIMDAKKYIKKTGIKWINIFQSFKDKYSIQSKYRIVEYPTFILINNSGKIIMRETGSDGFEVIRNQIKHIGS